MIKRKQLLYIIGLVAVAVRSVFATLFCKTLFRHYHLVPGLDMQTLLRFSQWGAEDAPAPPFFTFHRILIYICWKLNGSTHVPELLFVVQAVSGILAAMALADIVLMLTGKRRAAFFCGAAAAVYLPFLVYEFSVLQETFAVNSCVFAVWALLRIRKKRFPLWGTAAAGILLGISLLGRPSAILLGAALPVLCWLYCRKKAFGRAWKIYLASALVVLTAAGIFNTCFGWETGPFYNVLPYTNSYNAEAAGTPDKPSLLLSAKNAAMRLPKLLSIREIPENQNIYFWRKKIPDLNLFPGPEYLLPITIFAGIMLLFYGKIKRREMLVFIPILLLALPLCAREPIGRYRLMLCPWFILVSTVGCTVIPRLGSKAKTALVVITGIGGALTAILLSFTAGSGVRNNDYLSWAIACENLHGKTPQTVEAFYDFWAKSNFRSDRAFYEIQRISNQCNDESTAVKTIKEAFAAGKVNPDLLYYSCAIIHLRHQDAPGVALFFSKINPEKLPPELRPDFDRINKETARIMQIRIQRRLNNRPKRIIL